MTWRNWCTNSPEDDEIVDCVTWVCCNMLNVSPGYVSMSERYDLSMTQLVNCITWVWRNWWTAHLSMTQLVSCITWVWRNWWTVSPEYDAIGELYHLSMTQLVSCITWVWRNWWTVSPHPGHPSSNSLLHPLHKWNTVNSENIASERNVQLIITSKYFLQFVTILKWYKGR